MKLCTCLKCGNIYEDSNPGNESIEYDNSAAFDPLPLIKDEDGDECYGCPVCGTDGNLVDNIHPIAVKPSTMIKAD